jgi:hypothetical protein
VSGSACSQKNRNDRFDRSLRSASSSADTLGRGPSSLPCFAADSPPVRPSDANRLAHRAMIRTREAIRRTPVVYARDRDAALRPELTSTPSDDRSNNSSPVSPCAAPWTAASTIYDGGICLATVSQFRTTRLCGRAVPAQGWTCLDGLRWTLRPLRTQCGCAQPYVPTPRRTSEYTGRDSAPSHPAHS